MIVGDKGLDSSSLEIKVRKPGERISVSIDDQSGGLDAVVSAITKLVGSK